MALALDAFSSELFDNTKETLDHPPSCVEQECAFGNLALDAVLESHILHSTGIPRAIINGRGSAKLRKKQESDINSGRVFTTFPISDSIIGIGLTGREGTVGCCGGRCVPSELGE